MVFTGDWNGGERTFTVRRGQFSFKGLSRFGDGGFRPMVADPKLDEIDDYSLDGTRLRWRSRRTSDPPFAGAPFRYQVRYALSGILVKEGDHFLLDHDFAFADRKGPIDRFVLHLSLDPVWKPLSELKGTYAAGPLAPGTSFVLGIPLAYTGLESQPPQRLIPGSDAIDTRPARPSFHRSCPRSRSPPPRSLESADSQSRGSSSARSDMAGSHRSPSTASMKPGSASTS